MEHIYKNKEHINQEIERISATLSVMDNEKAKYSEVYDKAAFFEKLAELSENNFYFMKKAMPFLAAPKWGNSSLGDFMMKTPIFVSLKALYEAKNDNDTIFFPVSCIFLNNFFIWKRKAQKIYSTELETENSFLFFSRIPFHFSCFLKSHYFFTNFQSPDDLVQVACVDFFTGETTMDKSLLPADVVRPEFFDEVAELLETKLKPMTTPLRDKLKDCSLDDVFRWYRKAKDEDCEDLGADKCQWDLTVHNVDFWLTAWLRKQWYETGATLENGCKMVASFKKQHQAAEKLLESTHDDVYWNKCLAEQDKPENLKATKKALVELVTPLMDEMNERSNDVKCYQDIRYKAVFCQFAGVVLDIESYYGIVRDVKCNVIALMPTNEQGKPKPNANLKFVKKSDFEVYFKPQPQFS